MVVSYAGFGPLGRRASRVAFAALVACATVALAVVAGTAKAAPLAGDAVPTQVLTPPAAAKQFGFALAISGDTAVIGAPAQAPSGEAYVYTRSGDTWAFEALLLPVGGGTNDRFGSTVAIDGDAIVVGAPLDDTALANAGAAYVFERVGTTWSQAIKVLPQSPVAAEQFGWDVAIGGGTAVVGAYDAKAGATTGAGAVYVYRRDPAGWAQQARLVADDPQAATHLGTGVAIDGDTLVAGARDATVTSTTQGAAYVFTRVGTAWTQQAKLVANDAAAGDQLGNNVAVSGDTALVGSLGANAAYVFARTGTTWSQQAQLAVAGTASFGVGVDLDGDRAIVGAPFTGGSIGVAHVFARTGTTWTTLDAPLQNAGGAAGDEFGRSVGVDGTTIAVGVPVPAQPGGRAALFVDVDPSLPMFADGFE